MTDFHSFEHGFDQFDESRLRHLAEMDGNRRIIEEDGRQELMGEIDRVETLGLEQIEKRRSEAERVGRLSKVISNIRRN